MWWGESYLRSKLVQLCHQPLPLSTKLQGVTAVTTLRCCHLPNVKLQLLSFQLLAVQDQTGAAVSGRPTRPPSLLCRCQRHLWSSNTPQRFVHNHSTIASEGAKSGHCRVRALVPLEEHQQTTIQPFLQNSPSKLWRIHFEPLLDLF